MLTLVSCKRKGVCTCVDDGKTTKTYYEDMSYSEKKSSKRICNGDSDAYITKTEASGGDLTYTNDNNYQLKSSNCEWSKDGE